MENPDGPANDCKSLIVPFPFVCFLTLTTKGYGISARCHVVHARVSQVAGAARPPR